MRQGLTKSAYLWEAHYKRGRSVSIDQCLVFEERWQKRVAKGEVTMDYEARLEE